VLSGEIRKPGSFSAEAIEVLARLSPEAGRLFQAFCNLTTEISGYAPAVFVDPALATPVHDIDGNELMEFGLPYDLLCRLQDAGLLRAQLFSSFRVPGVQLRQPVIAGRSFRFQMPVVPNDTSDELRHTLTELLRMLMEPTRCRVVRLTAAGVQLSRIVHMTPNEEYTTRLRAWLVRLGLVPVLDGE
jgi:hypothetical protein